MATAAQQKTPAANPANGANTPNPGQAITGAAKVTMPDQNGTFHIDATRGAVKHVQVVDVDMVLTMDDGSKIVLAGGALGAMDDKSKVIFDDRTQGTSTLLDMVGKIPLQNNDQSQILNSDPNKNNDHNANASADGNGGVDNQFTSNNNSAQVNPSTTSLLAKIIQDNAGSLTSNGLQNLALPSIPIPPTLPATNGADATVKLVSVSLPERQGAVLTPVVIGPQTPAMSVNLVNLATVTQVGSTLYGSGGSKASASDGSNIVQFAPQVINAGDDVHTIYALGTIPQGSFVKVFNISVTGDGTVQSVVISGVPPSMTILNAVNLGGGQYMVTPVGDQKTFALQVQYSTMPADPTAPVQNTTELKFDVNVLTTDGLIPLSDSRLVVIKDASSYTDLTYLDPATGKSVWVLPAQGVPHEIHAGNGGVTIYGSDANDLLYGGAGNDIIIGGSGNTYFEGGAGADVLTGGTSGINTAGYKGSTAGVTVNLVTGLGTGGDAQGDVLTNIQNVIGSSYDDTIVANAGVNRIDGGAGGSDTVSYAASTAGVTVNLITNTGTSGYAQGDTYVNIQNVIGSSFSDMFVANNAVNHFDGGAGGSDTVSYATSAAGVNVNLKTGIGAGGSAAGDTYTHIQNVIGSAFDDVFTGNIDANSFDGGSGGSDTVSYVGSAAGVTVNLVTGRGIGGDAAGDTYNRIQNVVGSAFDDVIIVGPDTLKIDGGSGGSDTVNYGASSAGVTVNLITNTGTGGYAQNNVYVHIQNATGSSYSDTFIANNLANHFDGGLAGSDTVSYANSNAGVTVSLYDGSASGGFANGDTLAHIQNVIGSDFDDTFIASSEVNNFEGGLGSNTVSYFYATGSVVIDLNNSIGTGTGGSLYANGDTFSHIQNLIGGASDDTFVASADANRLDGGINSQHNRVSYAASNAGVTVNLNYTDGTGTSGGYAAGDQLINVQDLTGSAFDDTFVASNVANNFDGGAGSNTVSYANSATPVTVDLVALLGSGGDAAGDTYVNIQNVIGSIGDDTFIASSDANRFTGGGGNDTVSYAKASDANGVTVDLINGVGTGGFAAGDTYVGIKNVIGTNHDDTFIATSDTNVFNGLQGSDTVSYAYSTAGVTVNLVTGTGTGGYAALDTYTSIENIIGSSQDDLFVASSDANTLDGGVSTATSHNRVSYASSNTGVTVDLNYTNGTGTSGGYAQGDKLINIQDLTGSSSDDTFVANAASNNFDGGVSTAASHNRVSYAASNAAVTVDLNSTNGSGTSGGYAAGDTFVNIQDLTGSALDDTFVASSVSNYFDGGAGSVHNRVSYSASNAGVTVDLNYTDGTGTSGGYAAGDRFINIQDLTGSTQDDIFVASNVANNFDGGTGTLHNRVSYAASNAGVTVDLNNTDGTGTSGGYAAGDTFVNIQDLTGGAGDDTFVANALANYLDGGASTASSHNRVSYASSNTGVVVDLNFTDGTGTSGGYAAGDRLSNIQDLTGSTSDDIFVASAAANYLDGGTSTAGSHNRVSYASSNAGVTVDLNFTDGTGTSGGYAAGDRLSNIQDLTGSTSDDIFVASAAANNFDGGTSTATSHNRVSYASSNAGVTVDLNFTNGTGTSGGYAAGDTLVNIQDLTGSASDDTFVASNVSNYFDGGTSTATSHNRVSYAASNAGVIVDLNNTTGSGTSGGYAAGDRFANIQDLTGSASDDTFVASAAANYLDGGTSTATSHNRVSYASSTAGVTVDLNFTDGTNTTGGYATGDRLSNIQDLTGSASDDTFIASSANNNFDGGTSSATSHNRVSYASSNAGVVVDLNSTTGAGTSGGYAAGDTFVNIQDLTGSASDDTFVASVAANNFDGGTSTATSHNRVSYASSNAGVIVDLNSTTGAGTSGGYAAGDTFVNIQDLTGSTSDDTFVASAAANYLDGGTGSLHNRVSYAASNAGVTVDLNFADGTGTSGGYAAGDRLTNIQDLTGSASDDTFVASLAANYFDGGTSVTGSHNRVSYAASNAAVTVDLNFTDGTGTSGGYAAGDRFINIQDITGSGFNDTFVANGVANNFDGGAGSDTVSYSASGVAVTVNLSSGAAGIGGFAQGDTYTSIENVIGGSAGDTLTGATTGATVLTGGGGGDTLAGVASNRANTYASYAGSASGVTVDLNFTDGTGTSGGDAAGDKLSFIDNLIGSGNDDIFISNAQANSFDGGAGFDTVSYISSNAGVTVNLSNGSTGAGGYAQGDTYANMENIIGSTFADVLTGAATGKTVLTGLGGGDTLAGTAANHANTYASYAGSASGVTVDLNYTDGTGTSGGDAAGDKLSLIDNLIGSSSSDTFVANNVANSFDGGAGGSDTVSYLASNAAVTVDLSNTTGAGTSGGYAAGDKFTGISNIIGSNYDDTFYANASANAFNGSGHGTNGDTVSYARSNIGVLVDLYNHVGGDSTGTVSFAHGDTYSNIQNATGGGGNDIFVADGNVNRFDGGAGTDTVSYQYANSGSISASLVTHTGTGGDAAGDTYTNIENLTGSANVDSTLIGDGNANTLTALGTTNTNVLTAGGASSGTDVLDARLGGHNTLTAGAGNNTFMVSAQGSDTIVNSTTGLANITDANGNANGGVTTLHFDNLGSSLDISKFAGTVHGISTLDISSSNNTNILIGSADVQHLGVNNVLTIKLTGNESLQIQSGTTEHYRIFANNDYVFYDSATFTNEIARIHISVV